MDCISKEATWCVDFRTENQGADFKNNQTTKQLNNFFGPIGRYKQKFTWFLLVQIELFICLVVWLFSKSEMHRVTAVFLRF